MWLNSNINVIIYFCRAFVDSLKRVECKINGTFDPLIESTSPSVIEDSIISALDERGYSAPGSNVTSGELLCYCVSMRTT